MLTDFFVRYVMMVVFDPSLQRVVGLTKLKGPAKLLNRITFPGGKIEHGEDIQYAASRELLEETGVTVAARDWTLVDATVEETYSLTVLAAVSSDFDQARTCEMEPVHKLNVQDSLQAASEQPEKYVSDFSEVLQLALQKLKR